MTKCALVGRDRFIKYIIRDYDELPRYFSTARQIDAVLEIDTANSSTLVCDIVDFCFDRSYINEHEEEVAIYYER